VPPSIAFLAHSHRRRYPTRADVFRPGDPAGTLYYVVSGSVSIMAEEDEHRELVLGYFGAGEFVGEMGLFVESDRREVILRTRTQCELAEIGYERCTSCWPGRWPPMPRACCTPSACS
jgi:CRP/FNR family cyclic AMP-dependent transcriptional regulator